MLFCLTQVAKCSIQDCVLDSDKSLIRSQRLGNTLCEFVFLHYVIPRVESTLHYCVMGVKRVQ